MHHRHDTATSHHTDDPVCRLGGDGIPQFDCAYPSCGCRRSSRMRIASIVVLGLLVAAGGALFVVVVFGGGR